MTRTEAQSVLQRAAAGEHFTDETMREAFAMLVQRDPMPAPAGCRWERQASGWLDLRRLVQ